MNRQSNACDNPAPLAELCRGQHAQVQAVAGGHGMKQRMQMIGIRPGVELKVVHGPGRRGAVVLVGGTRIALGRGVIDRIMVTPQTTVHEAAPVARQVSAK